MLENGFRVGLRLLKRHAPGRRGLSAADIRVRLRLPHADTSAVAPVAPCYPQSRPVFTGLHWGLLSALVIILASVSGRF
jgi:hypothetical protein